MNRSVNQHKKAIGQQTKPADERLWRAFRTRPRHEKRAAERCADQGIEIYCPLIEARVRWSDRWKRVQKPLFTGYLFARVSEKERIGVLQDPSVVRTVTWLGKPAHIRDEEIETIRALLGEEIEDVRVEPIRRGDRVTVANWQLGERTGEVLEILGDRVRLRLDSLQCELTFTIARAQLKRNAAPTLQAIEG